MPSPPDITKGGEQPSTLETALTKRSVLFKATLLIAPVVIFLGLAEAGLRLYFSYRTFYDVEVARYANTLKNESPNPLIGHVHRPGKSMYVMGVDVTINSDGFRDDEYEIEKGQNRRIILLGDSLTFGWGVEKEQSFEHLLERKFNAIAPTEIINFGTGDYNTTQEVNLFEEKGLRYRPDAVFLFYFINDAEPVPKKSGFAWLAHFRIATFFWSRTKALLAKKSPSEGFKEYYANLYRADQAGWLQTQQAFLKLRELSRDNGISLKVVILPELHNLVDYTFKDEHALVSRYLSRHGIENIDLAPSFADQKNPTRLWVARDDAHPNAEAHRLIAEYSFPFLSEERSRKE